MKNNENLHLPYVSFIFNLFLNIFLLKTHLWSMYSPTKTNGIHLIFKISRLRIISEYFSSRS